MEDNLKHIELIEAYHEGKLSHEEKVDFEVRLLIDQELQEENELYKKVLYGFHDIKADQIRAKLKLIDNEIDQKKKVSFRSRKYFWFASIAASLVIILFIFENYFFNPSFDTKYIPNDLGIPVLMGAGNKLDFDNAMSDFKNGDFENAMDGFNKNLKANPASDTALFYLGNCYLHLGNFNRSTDLFSELNSQKNSSFYAKGQYYLALSYWANGNTKQAKVLFKTIAATPGHPFQSQSILMANKFR